MQAGKLYRYAGPGNNKRGGFDDGNEYTYINDKGEVNYYGNGSGTEKYHYFEEYEEKEKETKELSARELYLKIAAFSGLKVGDTVKVVKRFTEGEAGVNIDFNSLMENGIGKEFQITDTNPLNGGFELDNHWWWPFYCLEKIVVPPVEIQLNDEYTAVVAGDKQTVKVGCQTFSREAVLELAEKLKK